MNLGLKAPELFRAKFLSWPALLTLASVGSIHDVEPLLDILHRGPDRAKALSELLQRLDLGSKEPKFECLDLGTGFGDFVTSRSQRVPLRWSYIGYQR